MTLWVDFQWQVNEPIKGWYTLALKFYTVAKTRAGSVAKSR